jgi:hypothetical protein
MNTGRFFKSTAILVFVAATPIFLSATERTTVSLNGTWDIEDSKEAEAIPSVWPSLFLESWND